MLAHGKISSYEEFKYDIGYFEQFNFGEETPKQQQAAEVEAVETAEQVEAGAPEVVAETTEKPAVPEAKEDAKKEETKTK
jgi:hypothetical protein